MLCFSKMNKRRKTETVWLLFLINLTEEMCDIWYKFKWGVCDFPLIKSMASFETSLKWIRIVLWDCWVHNKPNMWTHNLTPKQTHTASPLSLSTCHNGGIQKSVFCFWIVAFFLFIVTNSGTLLSWLLFCWK